MISEEGPNRQYAHLGSTAVCLLADVLGSQLISALFATLSTCDDDFEILYRVI